VVWQGRTGDRSPYCRFGRSMGEPSLDGIRGDDSWHSVLLQFEDLERALSTQDLQVERSDMAAGKT